MRTLRALIELARPSHWLKNLLVFAALVFSGQFLKTGDWWPSLLVFAQFCLLSSAAYAFNDIFDRRADAANPRSRHRPIPSGRVTVAQAAIEGLLLLVGGLSVSFALGVGSLVVASAYLLAVGSYNLLFRRHPIADVVTIAMGFVLRAIAGGVAIHVPASGWLIVCTFMLSVFLALIKRRAEIVTLGAKLAISARPVHAFYTIERLDHMLAVSAGLAVVTYVSYCMGDHSPGVHMVWTVPVVLYGMFRLYGLAVGSSPAGPVELIKRDRVMWLVAVVWLAIVVAVLRTRDWPVLEGWIVR